LRKEQEELFNDHNYSIIENFLIEQKQAYPEMIADMKDKVFARNTTKRNRVRNLSLSLSFKKGVSKSIFWFPLSSSSSKPLSSSLTILFDIRP
jgi:hypothetical protein